jgi:sugar phosphate isomerase/epimerase
MARILSTYLFIHRRLTATLVAEIARSGVTSVELFCARGHFDYHSDETARELAQMLRDANLSVHAVHAPASREAGPAREGGTPLSISNPERMWRLEAVDEIKRALDLAEFLPFRYLVQHLGSSHDDADPRRFDAAFSSLEQLHIFAKQRGVTIALENTPGELATPANLRQFLAGTRLHDLKLCFDFGHAHLEGGVLPSLETMRELAVTAHVHDNHGLKDEHLPPFDGTIDWKVAFPVLPPTLPLVLELKEQPAFAEPAPAAVALEAAQRAFDKMEEAIAAANR